MVDSDSRLTRFRKYKWILLVTSIWAGRMALATIAMAIPFFIEVYNEISGRGNEYHTIQTTAWANDMDILLQSEDENFPRVLTGVPVPPFDRMIALLPTLQPSVVMAKKQISSGIFQYHASERSWSTKLNISGPEYEYEPMSMEDVLRNIYGEGIYSGRPYYYITYEIKKKSNAFVAAAAPYLLQLGDPSVIPPQMRLWLSSPGAVASWHFDMESNYFVQLTGSKTFLLLNADAYLFMNPRSYLHPSWRQAEYAMLTTLSSVIELAIDFMDSQNVTQCTGTSTIYQNHHKKNSICRYNSLIKSGSTKESAVMELFGIISVELTAGDVLHLPPFVFHCVISGEYSSSLNIWLGSKELSISNKLQKIPLPFLESASFTEQLLSVRHTIMRLFSMFGHGGVFFGLEYSLFSTALAKRYKSMISSVCDIAVVRGEPELESAQTCALGCDNHKQTLGEICRWDLSETDVEKIQNGAFFVLFFRFSI